MSYKIQILGRIVNISIFREGSEIAGLGLVTLSVQESHNEVQVGVSGAYSSSISDDFFISGTLPRSSGGVGEYEGVFGSGWDGKEHTMVGSIYFQEEEEKKVKRERIVYDPKGCVEPVDDKYAPIIKPMPVKKRKKKC